MVELMNLLAIFQVASLFLIFLFSFQFFEKIVIWNKSRVAIHVYSESINIE